MKALVYHGPGQKSLEDRPKPVIVDPGNAIVRVTHTRRSAGRTCTS